MKRAVQLLALGAYFILAPPTAWSLPYLAEEPAIETLADWNILPNGMLYAAYDLDRNGKAEFFTVRMIEKSFVSTQTVQEAANGFPNCKVFFVNYSHDRYFYIVSARPLFYAIDVNEDGIWDLMYKDVLEDGVNGNET
ncbi:MAG: hypothetical protein HZA02_03420, partial [Nitrospinae bacterium]|nr:hypothetical protein [Nitrospinota bacterium]